MTIEKARELCKLQLDGLMSNPQVTLDSEYIKAERTAIACMNALEEIRQDAVDAIEDGLYVRNTRILDIIDKYLKDGEQNE